MAQDQISYYIGPSKASCALMEQVERLAKSDTTVLVVGEPGSGKNMIVRELHARSPRAGTSKCRFVVVIFFIPIRKGFSALSVVFAILPFPNVFGS